MFSLLALIGLGVFWRILHIQIAEHEQWAQFGNELSTSVQTITPTRGQILAHDGRLLASSVPVYDLTWDPTCPGMNWDLYHEEQAELVQILAEATGKKTEVIQAKFDRAYSRKGIQQIVKGIPFDGFQRLESLSFVQLHSNKNGLLFDRRDERLRPFNGLAARTIGEHRESNSFGLEAAWNEELAGVQGEQATRRVGRNLWAPISSEFIVDPIEGSDITTTIDLHIQDVANAALDSMLRQHDAAWGTVVVCEVSTGYIRAMSNLKRVVDQNDVVIYKDVLNYAVAETIEPGSTFKLASLIACMEAGMDITDTVDAGNGRAVFGGIAMTDGGKRHGEIPLIDVFAKSSNIGSAVAVERMFKHDPQRFIDALRALRAGEKSGIDLSGEPIPVLFTDIKDPNWSGTSLTRAAIGYNISLTPLQSLMLYNAIANGGKWMRPQLVTSLKQGDQIVRSFPPVVEDHAICSAQTIEACKSMLEAVCNPEGSGTAKNVFKNKPYTVAGKTGTARVSNKNGYEDNLHRASFAGYFPADNPQYSCIVVISEPQSDQYYGNKLAAPVFAQIADVLYATDPAFHTVHTGLLADYPTLPQSKDGARIPLEIVYHTIDLPFSTDNTGDWVDVRTTDSLAVLTETLVPQSGIPDVIGMGLRDALYLLENAGLQVEYDGIGTVSNQSIPPGTPLSEELNMIRITLS